MTINPQTIVSILGLVCSSSSLWHFAGELQRIVAAGGYLENKRVTTQSSSRCLDLSRAIGDFEYKNNDSLQPEEQVVTADPDIEHHVLTDDEEFLILACDGGQILVEIVERKLTVPSQVSGNVSPLNEQSIWSGD